MTGQSAEPKEAFFGPAMRRARQKFQPAHNTRQNNEINATVPCTLVVGLSALSAGSSILRQVHTVPSKNLRDHSPLIIPLRRTTFARYRPLHPIEEKTTSIPHGEAFNCHRPRGRVERRRHRHKCRDRRGTGSESNRFDPLPCPCP